MPASSGTSAGASAAAGASSGPPAASRRSAPPAPAVKTTPQSAPSIVAASLAAIAHSSSAPAPRATAAATRPRAASSRSRAWARRSASRRAVTSRVALARPTTRPPASRSGSMRVSRWAQPPSTRRPRKATVWPCPAPVPACSSRTATIERSSGWARSVRRRPTRVAGAQPSRRAAASFTDEKVPSSSRRAIRSGLSAGAAAGGAARPAGAQPRSGPLQVSHAPPPCGSAGRAGRIEPQPCEPGLGAAGASGRRAGCRARGRSPPPRESRGGPATGPDHDGDDPRVRQQADRCPCPPRHARSLQGRRAVLAPDC